VVFLLTEFPLHQQKSVSFTFRYALIFVDTYAHTLFLEVGSAPSGYMDFKFISLPLAIVRIDCTIVRVIKPQRLLVVLRNGISKERI
jgi:hypothetical protein